MGQDFRYQCPVETWRLLWFLGIMFVVIMAFQHFELPSGYILSSISSVHSNQIAENGSVSTIGALSKPEIVSNMTHLNAVNPKDADDSHGHGREKHPDVNNDFASDTSVVSNNSSLIDNHDKESSIQQAVQPTVRSTADPLRTSGNRYVPEETGLSKNPRISDSGIAPFMPVLPPEVSSSNMTFPMNVESNMVTPVVDVDSNTSAVEKYETPILANHGKSGELKNKITRLYDNSSSAPNSYLKKTPETQTSGVISVMEMNNLLLQSWSSPMMRSPRWASPVDQELLQAKSQIENAPIIKNDPKLYAHLYWNLSMFKRSYEIMEENLKVYIYKEGEKPILHQPVLKGIYASEGWFMKQLEASKKFVTKKSRKAHLFYLPFSSRNLELQLYVPDSHSRKNLIKYLKNYLDLIVAKYPFWNRTEGVDHFLVACHDWAASETEQLMFNCIRALCNADVKEGFIFGKDASLPETNVRTPQNPLRDLGGKPPSKRSILAFFAGSMHGYLRPILLKHWGNKDPDMKIFSQMPKARGKMNYVQHMKSSRYCICARGYEVNSPRIVEAILYECVPVIISDNYVPPFFEVLNWESFAVFVLEKDIPNLKNILLSIPEKRYREMQMRVKMVQQHFLWHARPVKYDLFHMILHSVWYNRVFQMHPR
ncbi:probable glycosyltransferase At3g07620 [Ricinus communis]|uniref:probable glycosyltransferase At3g07620 n=1 Tax=Ricinus communis TaxID=3988 RepID=UPI00201A8235|nr:probable glycosyltransferase At3g07620 [Ricinus communis]XP_048227908.1 probable glycosyltransferase At3g07620 [Ricinus communis]